MQRDVRSIRVLGALQRRDTTGQALGGRRAVLPIEHHREAFTACQFLPNGLFPWKRST